MRAPMSLERQVDKSHDETGNELLVPNAGQIHLEKGQLWGTGVKGEFKTTVGTHWVKEMTNFNQKTISTTILVFITVIAPTLTFGAVYGKVTENNIGAVETLLATAWVGVVYALIGGMPMCIMGSTGPVLAVSSALYKMSESIGVPFLTFNLWVSVWLLIYISIASFMDMTRFVRLATRFTDEIFALLIVSIFVKDAVGDPWSDVGIFRYYAPGHESHEDRNERYSYLTTALLSTILGLGTCWLIFFFRSFKYSAFFSSDGIRTSIHDFSVAVSVLIWSVVAAAVFTDVKTEKLSVPENFEPSFQCCDDDCKMMFPDDCEGQAEAAGTRDWVVGFGDLNGKNWVPIMAAGPAILAFLLCFLDNGITWHLINHKSHKLAHGEAYNYDLLLNGIFNFVNAMLGLPWLVATTVPCIMHLNALADKDEQGHFVRVQETRLSALLAHLLVGVSLAALSLLKLLPLPVLYGVFLFMGLSSLPNIQFWKRIQMFFQQTSRVKETPYTKYMRIGQIHLYTIFQLVFFAGVFIVQNTKAISIGFPFMTLLCIPGRIYLAPRFFAGWELVCIDGEDDDIDEWVAAKEGIDTVADLEHAPPSVKKVLVHGADIADEREGRFASDVCKMTHGVPSHGADLTDETRGYHS